MTYFDFSTLIPDLQVEVLKNCEVSELAAVAPSSQRCKDLTKNEFLWQRLSQLTFNLNVKTCNTWYETYINQKRQRKWATDLLSGNGFVKIRRLMAIDPQTWHYGSARIVQAPQQPIIVTPAEFNKIPKDLSNANSYILHNGNYYFLPLNEQMYTVIRLKSSHGWSYPALYKR